MDTNNVAAYEQGIDFYKKGKLNPALECFKRANKIFEEHENKQGISDASRNIGNVYLSMGEWGHALEYFNESLKISEELGDKQRIANAFGSIGNVCLRRGKWEQALQYYKESLKISEELGNEDIIIKTLNNIGIIHGYLGEWKQALEDFEKSLAISEKLGDKQTISEAFGNIGITYGNIGEWGLALEYYNRSLEISDDSDLQGILNTHNNIGEIDLKTGNLEEAKYNLEKALKIAENLSPISKVDVLVNLSELFRLRDDCSKALKNLKEALYIVRNVGDKPQEIVVLEKCADIYISKYIANKGEKYLSLAEERYKQALELASGGQLNMLLQEATAIRGIGIIQAKKRNLKASKESFMKSIEILHRLGAKFELQKTYLEYARALYKDNCLFDAEIMANSAAFEALYNNYHEQLMKTYLLLGDIRMRQMEQYKYYLDALKVAEFNPRIYVKTFFFIAFRMKNMEKQILLEFIKSLKELNKNEFFNLFLDSLNTKMEGGKAYDTAGLPSSLVEVIDGFP